MKYRWECMKYHNDILHTLVSGTGDEYPKTPEQDRKTSRPVPQLSQPGQRQLGPT